MGCPQVGAGSQPEGREALLALGRQGGEHQGKKKTFALDWKNHLEQTRPVVFSIPLFSVKVSSECLLPLRSRHV